MNLQTKHVLERMERKKASTMEKRWNFTGHIDKGTPTTKKSHFGRCQKCETGENQTRVDSTEQPMD